MRKIMTLWCLLPLTVLAQPMWPELLDVDLSYRNSALLAPDQNWDVRLGFGFENEPTYQGSDRSETEASPYLLAAYRADWGNLYLAGDGLGFSRLFDNNFAINLQLEQEDTREESADNRLIGLGNQDEELELEISGRYFMGPWSLDTSVAVATGDKGLVWFIGGGYNWRVMNERMLINLRSDLSGSNAKNQQTDFGITAIQSQNSVINLPEYTATGGLKSLGLHLTMDYQINKNWYLFANIDAERLLGDVADSPLVKQIGTKNNFEYGLGLYYRF